MNLKEGQLNNSNQWGQGFDYLFEEIWPNLDKMREDNLNYSHDTANIEYCFSYMYSVLSTKAIEAVKKTDWEESDKSEVITKINSTLSLFKEAGTINEKVIAINIAEQLLRAIY